VGSVRMGLGGSHRFEGACVQEIAYCLYCDKCGSFNIKCHTAFETWELLFVFLVMLVSLVTWIFNLGHPLLCIFLALPCFVMLFLSDSFKHRSHICEECGTKHTSNDNTRNCPANDRSVLDIPYENTIRYYMDDY
jgi:hypothetical protein